MNSKYQAPLIPGEFYHLFNRANTQGEKLFPQERNYLYFLQKWTEYVGSGLEVLAYCLIPNHFHSLVPTLLRAARVGWVEVRLYAPKPASGGAGFTNARLIRMTPKTTRLIRKYFSARPVARAWLFGSAARGETTASSDLDLLVELDKGVSLFDFVRFKLELENLLHQPVDLVSTKGLSPHIKPFIEQDRQLIYERIPG